MSALTRLSAACTGVLVTSTLVVGPWLTGPAAASELLVDGGFEAATGASQLDSPGWAEADSLYGSPICNASLCSDSVPVAPPRTGTKWVVFGGAGTSTHTSSLSQSTTIPVGTAALTYWYRNGLVSSPYTATLLVKVDGATVRTHTEASSAQSSYALQTIDLSSYANGASHTISFSYANNATGDNVMGVDDVSLTHTPPPVTATPTLTGTLPVSPSSSTTPKVTGTAEAGSTVTLYSNSVCTSAALGSGSAADLAGSGITATVPANATTTIFAKATKAAQTSSACSASPLSYTNDSTAPAAPSLSALTPASPSASTVPFVTGAAEAGSTVSLYTNAACTGPVAAAGTASALGSPGVSVAVAAGGVTALAAKATDAAGNVSACSASLSYTNTAAELLQDGGFEGATGNPADSPAWTEADTVYGTPLCVTATCGVVAGSSGPRSGAAWADFGDSGVAGHTSSVSQAVVIPVGSVVLTYSYRNSAVNAPFDASLLVKVDGTTVRTLTEATVAQTAYAPQTIDLSAFANGASHTVSLHYTNGAVGVNRMEVDDVSLAFVAQATPPPSVPSMPSAPDTSLTKTPKKKVLTTKQKAKVDFQFSSPSAGATFQCSIDGSAFSPCTSGVKFKLKAGKHRFSVRAVVSGLMDPTPAAYDFKVKRKT